MEAVSERITAEFPAVIDFVQVVEDVGEIFVSFPHIRQNTKSLKCVKDLLKGFVCETLSASDKSGVDEIVFFDQPFQVSNVDGVFS